MQVLVTKQKAFLVDTSYKNKVSKVTVNEFNKGWVDV
jgi:hypothetical protein